MPSSELDNLVRIGKLKEEPPGRSELEGLIRSGEARLADAPRTDLLAATRELLGAVQRLQLPHP